ncbi:hypothetical protein PG996_016164 [Apiospora saccharicola]|uniref:Uncharacterized protein n=1 Tax=Apiospora saccharicola TaxID=335842 RepID=A0ABR1TN51_9PEZI
MVGLQRASPSQLQLQQQEQKQKQQTNNVRVSLALPQAELHEALLLITWVHHSSIHIVERVRPSLRSLKDATISCLCNKLDAFENVTDDDNVILRPSVSGSKSLQTTVKSVCFGDRGWDLTSYRGNDLTRLFAIPNQGAVPMFEVEVDYIRLRT